ncbi:MAG: YfiR family protein [Caulobacteraceae bacterium]|nr:YfiR family protein [Caulobacteraceae bacterium]
MIRAARRQSAPGWAILALSLVLAGPALAEGSSLEYPVKANYLVKFAGFVQWPPTAFASPTTPMTLCVVGEDPFGSALDRAAATESLEGRRLVIRRMDRIDARSGCHIAYLGASRRQTVGQALTSLAGAPVLTVTDAARGGSRGVIHFAVTGNRVRFHIDDRAAAQDGLTISSRLLALALSVRGRGDGR